MVTPNKVKCYGVCAGNVRTVLLSIAEKYNVFTITILSLYDKFSCFININIFHNKNRNFRNRIHIDLPQDTKMNASIDTEVK